MSNRAAAFTFVHSPIPPVLIPNIRPFVWSSVPREQQPIPPKATRLKSSWLKTPTAVPAASMLELFCAHGEPDVLHALLDGMVPLIEAAAEVCEGSQAAVRMRGALGVFDCSFEQILRAASLSLTGCAHSAPQVAFQKHM